MKKLKLLLFTLVQHFRSHIRYQLFFSYTAVILTVMITVGSVVYYFVPGIIQKNYYQYMEELNSQIILNIRNTLSQMEQTSLMLNFDEDLKMVLDVDETTGNIITDSRSASYKYIDNYFFNFIYSFQAIHGAYIYSINGDNIYTRNENQAFHYARKVNEELWFQDALIKKGNKIILGRHRNGYVNDKTEVISLVRSIIDYNTNRTLGIVVIEVDVSRIGKIIGSIDMKEKIAVTILDESNALIYSNDMPLYQTLKKAKIPKVSSTVERVVEFSLERNIV